MVDLKTAIDEINTGKIYFSEKEVDTTMTTEGEVVVYLKRLHDLDKTKEKLENMRFNPNGLDGKSIDIIVDILNNGTYADIFNKHN